MKESSAVPKVAICYTSSDMVHADFALSLAGLCLGVRDLNVTVINAKSSIVAMARNNGVERAQAIGADYLLFLDSDMVFPRDTLERLMSHHKDVVGAVYTKRLPPYELLGTPATDAHVEDNDLVEMKRLPTGCLLIAMRVFTLLKRPFFHFETNLETGGLLGEDYAFCEDARAAGIRIWADFALSQKIGHIGQHICRVPTAEHAAPDYAPKDRQE